MKKIIFCNIMMFDKLDKFIYPLEGKVLYNKEISFPINAILSKELKKGDDVLAVLLTKNDIGGNCVNNAEVYKAELNDINKNIGANIEYKIIDSDFDESKGTQEKLLSKMVNVLSEKAEVYCDMTYGPKSLPIIQFSVLNFGEKHFDIDLKYLVYGKVDFVDSNPCNPSTVNMTPLYYLNSLTNTIECSSSDESKRMLNAVLSLDE